MAVVAHDVLVSVVAVTQNDQDIIGGFLEELSETLAENFRYYEIVIVDDGSRDKTVGLIHEAQTTLKNIQLFCLPRRSGSEVAQVAGLENAIGDLVIMIEPRVDPPEPLVSMVSKASEESVDLVYALPLDRLHPDSVYARLSNAFFRMLARLSDVKMPAEASRYRLLSRRLVNYILTIADRHRTVSVAPALSGFSYTTVEYERKEARVRTIRSGVMPRLREATDLIVSTSMRPLRMVTILALVFSLVAMLYGGIALSLKYWFIPGEVAPGWTSLSLQVSGLFFLTFLILAVMSEYILRVNELANRHPAYHIQSESRSSVMDYEQDLNVKEQWGNPL